MTTKQRPFGRRARSLAALLVAVLAAPGGALGRARATPSPAPTTAPVASGSGCRAPRGALTLRLPGKPLSLAQTADGCYLFVGLAATAAAGDARGIVLLHREGHGYGLVRVFDVAGSTSALAISRDGSLLAASVLDHGIVVLDVARSLGGDPAAVVADLVDPSVRQTAALAWDAGATHLYAVDRVDSAIIAIDMAAAREGSGSRPVLFSHRMPLDLNPAALTVSPDGARLYVAVATRSSGKKLDASCRAAYSPGAGNTQPDGDLAVLDLTRADRDGVAPVVTRLDVGCAPTDVAASADGAVVWIAAHGDHAIVAVDATKLGTGASAIVERTTLGFEPDVLAAVSGGDLLVAAGYVNVSDLEHEFAIIPRATTLGRSTLKARIPVGRFPRAVLAFADGGGAIVASYDARTLALYPLAALRALLEPPVTLHPYRAPTPRPRRIKPH